MRKLERKRKVLREKDDSEGGSGGKGGGIKRQGSA
jgi:hypothetical protein